MSRNVLVIASVALLTAATASAHLCNDVFAQAKDNLAVKVDIRDGQLRIGDEASFRVYLLNTMDRDIDRINLDVDSQQFDATVEHSPAWKSFPGLKAKASGGAKEFFTVTLKRKAGVPDGQYAIGLKIVEGGNGKKNRGREFKTVNLDEAAGVLVAPKAVKIVADGTAGKDEWQAVPACSGLYTYEDHNGSKVNKPAAEDTRFRLAHDAKSLCWMASFQGSPGEKTDVATLYVAKGVDDAPLAISVDRLTGKVSCASGKKPLPELAEKIQAAVSADKATVECVVPLSALELPADAKSLRVNFTRTVSGGKKDVMQYWRGNSFSYQEPVVYGLFQLAP